MRISRWFHLLGTNNSVLPESLLSLFSALTYCERSGNELVGVVGGVNFTITGLDYSETNVIPGTSTCTLSLPNNSSLKTDDYFDTLWASDAGVMNNVTIPFLQEANYSRTLVRYSSESPYDIEWIGLLDDAAEPTDDQWNLLHYYFRLDFWWSGGFNSSAFEKENKAPEGQGYKGWIKEVIERSFTEPTETVKSSLNKTALHIIKNGSGAWYELDALWPFMLNDSSLVSTTGCVSMVRPDLTAPTLVNAITTTTSGLEGDGGTAYVNTNFNASTDGINYTISSASRFMLKYKAGVVVNGLDGHPSFTASNTMQNSSTSANRINVASNCVSANFGGTGYRAIDRNASAIAAFVDASKTTGTVAPAASLTSENFSILRNAFSSANTYCDAGVAFYGLGGHLTDAQHGVIRVALAAHKTRLGL